MTIFSAIKHPVVQRSNGGLFAFWVIRTILQVVIKSDQNPPLLLKVQAGQPAGLNLYHNLPTANLQGQIGYACKAVAHPLGASRFCALSLFWPYIRGRDGPG